MMTPYPAIPLFLFLRKWVFRDKNIAASVCAGPVLFIYFDGPLHETFPPPSSLWYSSYSCLFPLVSPLVVFGP